MTEYGKWLLTGCVLLLLLLAVIALWSVFFWLSLVLVCLGLVVLGFRVYGLVHLGITQAQLRSAAVAKARAQAQQQQAIAEQERATAAAYWRRVSLIPEGYVGRMLDTPAQAALSHIWTYKQEVSPAVAKLEQVEAPPVVEALPPALPGPTDLLQVLSMFKPSPTRILLALNAGGMLTCSLEGVSHVALAAPTGGGKSSIMRLLLSQMLAVGAHIWLADPHYTPLDPKSGEDWRMIEARPAQKPFTDAVHIKHVLAQLVGEMRRRYELRKIGRPFGDPCYLAIDEWPAILNGLGKDAKDVIADTTTLLREARKVGIYLITSSQDFLVETIGTGGEIRANLRTAYFAGGGIGTARALLDQKIKLPEDMALGKGLVLLRSEEALPVPGLVRVPYASNEALNQLLPLPYSVYAQQYGFTGHDDPTNVYPQMNPADLAPTVPTSTGPQIATALADVSLSSLSAPEPAKIAPKRVQTPEERERERIIAAIKEHPEWSASRIAVYLGFRNNNKITLIKSIKEELLEAEQEGSADNE